MKNNFRYELALPQRRLVQSTCQTRSLSETPRNFASARYHARSTVFDAAIEQASIEFLNSKRPQPSKSTYSPPKNFSRVRDHSTEDLFGSHKVDYYRKNLDESYKPNFEPQFKQADPWDYKVQDLYGRGAQFFRKNKVERVPESKLTSKDNYIRKVQKENSNETKFHASRSEVFRESYSRLNTQKNTPENKFPEKEYQPPLQSERLVQPEMKYENSAEIKPLNKERIYQRSKSATPQLTPRELKQTNLNHNYMKGPVEQSKVETVQISGLNSKVDEFYIKELCQGYHVISIDTKTDFLTGNCLGNATVTLRSKSNSAHLDKLKFNCLQNGLSLKAPKYFYGKKNNYRELSNRQALDANLEKKNSGFIVPVKSKPELQSSDSLYGSSPGVGRQYFKTLKKDNSVEAIYRWNKIRCSTPKNPSSVPRTANYLRPTISSHKKAYLANCNK